MLAKGSLERSRQAPRTISKKLCKCVQKTLHALKKHTRNGVPIRDYKNLIKFKKISKIVKCEWYIELYKKIQLLQILNAMRYMFFHKDF